MTKNTSVLGALVIGLLTAASLSVAQTNSLVATGAQVESTLR